MYSSSIRLANCFKRAIRRHLQFAIVDNYMKRYKSKYLNIHSACSRLILVKKYISIILAVFTGCNIFQELVIIFNDFIIANDLTGKYITILRN